MVGENLDTLLAIHRSVQVRCASPPISVAAQLEISRSSFSARIRAVEPTIALPIIRNTYPGARKPARSNRESVASFVPHSRDYGGPWRLMMRAGRDQDRIARADDLYLGRSRPARPLPGDFTGHVVHPSRSIETRLLLSSQLYLAPLDFFRSRASHSDAATARTQAPRLPLKIRGRRGDRHYIDQEFMRHKRLVSLNCRLCDRRRAGVRSGKAAGHDDQSRPLISSIRALPLALSKTRTVTGATKPAQPKGGAGPASSHLQAGVI